LQNPNQFYGDNMQNLRTEKKRTYRKKKKEYQKGKINDLESNNRKLLEFCTEI
jgi:hypothetical protein